MVDDFENSGPANAFANASLLDNHLFSKCLSFYSSVADHMMRLLCPLNPLQPDFKLLAEPDILVKLIPDWVVDDMADSLVFGLQFLPHTASTVVNPGLVTWLLTMLCHTRYTSNHYLVSKLVEVLFVVNPQVQKKTGYIYSCIMSHPICKEFLPGALMRIYAEVEQTRSSIDKFNIR